MFTRRDFLGVVGAAGALAAAGCQTVRWGEGAARGPGGQAGIDRLAVLARHALRVRSVNPAAVLSLGNGNFAFNVDCTGLQSLPTAYTKIPLATLSHWGWHTRPRPASLAGAELRYKQYAFHGRNVPYATDSSGQAELFNYLRENPHRLNLGRIGLVLDGREPVAGEISEVDQHLDLSTGILTSRLKLGGEAVEVVTCCHWDYDGIGVSIRSRLLRGGRLALRIAFGYGRSTFEGDGADWNAPNLHQTMVYEDPRAPGQVTLNRTLDAMRYGVRVDLKGAAGPLKETAQHQFILTSAGELLETCVCFDTEPFRATPLFTFAEARQASARGWGAYWNSGAAIDLVGCTDPRAMELERRIVLSQYLTAIHCAGAYPSQETGLLCNSWFGKFHLEMHWWHSVHFAAWDRQKHFGRTMFFYFKSLETARALAKSQGFKGARWPKMTSPEGLDSPSSVGPLLIWQQPHPIYYAEMCYRDDPTLDTLKRWREIVVETAEFMASYAQYVPGRNEYVLGPALRTVSENNDDRAINPTWELTAWRWGLAAAQRWLERMGQARVAAWDEVLNQLAPAPMRDGLYLLHEGQDTYSTQWAWEHPAMLGALGVLPGNGIDAAAMAATVRKVRQVWDFNRVWGWDYPTAALCAARTGQAELAIDFLTMDAPTNRYLANGCNFQRDNVPAYFPGNGGLLSAIALMAGGWDGGPQTPLPGFPKDGRWNAKAEGFRKWM